MRSDFVSIFLLICISCYFISFNKVTGARSSIFHKNGINVRKAVTQFLHLCVSENVTKDETVSKAVLCVENGVAQISGRSFRSNEDISSTCRVISSVVHCLKPLKKDLEKCTGKEEISILDLVDNLCKNGGAKIIEFEEGIQCVQMEHKVFKTCFEGTGAEKNLKNTLSNPCDAISILEKCTVETLNACPTRKPQKQFDKFVAELQSSNPHAYNCISRYSGAGSVNVVSVGDTNLESSNSTTQSSGYPISSSRLGFYYLLFTIVCIFQSF